jgi:hypothetical protein
LSALHRRHAYQYTVIRGRSGVLMRIGERKPLLATALLTPTKLSDDLLRFIGARYGLEGIGAEVNRKVVLTQVAEHVADGDAGFADKVTTADNQAVEDNMAALASDPMFDAAYEDLDESEKLEMKGYTEARQRGKRRTYKEAFGFRQVRRRQAKAKAKAKGKKKGAGKGNGTAGKGAGKGDGQPAASSSLAGAAVAGEPSDFAASSSAPAAAGSPLKKDAEAAYLRALKGERAEPFGPNFFFASVHPQGIIYRYHHHRRRISCH